MISVVILTILFTLNAVALTLNIFLARRVADKKILADEAYENARLLVEFVRELQKVQTEDEYIDLMLKWMPILKEHGIKIETL